MNTGQLRILLISFLFLIIFQNASAQCECTDCPIVIPNNGTESSFLDISGATNNTLGQGGQELCLLCINLTYDAIEELDMVLIAPSGDEVDLMINTGISVNDNITFEICFVPCNQSADPDPGFPAIFDTDAGYLPNETYDGVYYPADGCFEDLTGSVNGEWELEMTDNVFLDNGELLDWYLVFTDDSGIGCANAGECANSVSCLADGGQLSGPAFITECEGDNELDLTINPSYGGGGGPPASEYDYTFVIADANTDIVEDITMDTDLSSFPPGAYQICGLSYLIADESLLPTADGSLEVSDIEDQIDDGDYCADLSSGCTVVVIEAPVSPPTIAGPLEVCAGEPVEWLITDYDPSLNYQVFINAGSFSFFNFVDDLLTVEFISGPGEICFNIDNPVCGDEETCIDIVVLPSAPEFEIIGETEVCPGTTTLYTVEPFPATGTEYIYSIIGGTITDATDNTVSIEWPDSEGSAELCVDLIGTSCDIEPLCIDIDIEFDYDLPANLDSPDELCLGTSGSSEIPSSPDILNYNWTSTNLNITNGLNTNAVEYEPVAAGLATICLEIETNCGFQWPVCDEIDIFEAPEPEILDVSPSCNFSLTLEALTDADTELEWFVVSGPADVDFNPLDENITQADFSQAGLYEIGIEESNDACEASDIIEVEILDELQTEEPDITCDADYNYTVSFAILTGQAPYTVNGNEISSNVFVSEAIPSGDDYSFMVVDQLGCMTELEGDFECPCITDAGTMNDQLLSACIPNDELVEAEWNEDEVLDNNDIVVFYLHDRDDDELGNIIDFNTSGVFEYSDEIIPGETYYISAFAGNADGDEVDLSDECLSVAEGQPVIFYDNPQIDIEVNALCDNTVELRGQLPESVTQLNWTQVNGPETSEISDDDVLPITIEVNQAGSYIFEYEVQNEACIDFVELEIDFTGNPTVTNLVENCDSLGANYTVSFEISGGTAPYTIDGLDGTLTGSVFSSEAIPTGSSYSFTVADDNGCITGQFSGQKLCDCNTNAGSLPTSVIESCGTEDSIAVSVPQNAFLDPNDIAIFYLHSSTVLQVEEVLDSSYSGTFGFNENVLVPDVIYYVSYAVGNENDSIPDPEDLCFDFSNSQPVSWLTQIEADAGMDIMSCNDTILLNAFPEEGVWSIIDEVTGSNAFLTDSMSNNSSLVIDSEGTYTLSWQHEVNGCPDSDTVVVTRLADPQFVDINTECNDDLSTYNLTVELDENGPYVINQQNFSDFFIQDSIVATETFSATLVNVFGCSSELLVNPIDCSCESEIGSLNTPEIELCIGDIISTDIFNDDFSLSPNDTLFYVIHDGSSDSLGTILASYSSDIEYLTSLNTDIDYYLSMIIAPVEIGEPILDASCTLSSPSSRIRWLQENNVDFDLSHFNCIGDSITLIVSVDNYLPVEINFINNNNDSRLLTVTENIQEFTFEVSQITETWEVDNIEGTCLNDYPLSFEITAQEELEIELVDDIEICNNSLFGSTVNLNELLPDQSIEGVWDAGTLVVDNNMIDFDGLTEGSYNLVFSTEGFEDPCPGSNFSTTITVLDCDCPVFSFEDLNLCNSESAYNLEQFDLSGFEGEWSIDPVSNNSAEIVDNQLIIENRAAGTYTLSLSITDPSYPQECTDIFTVSLELEAASTAGMQTEFPVYCEDESAELFLNDLVEGATEGGQWIFNGDIVSDVIETDILSLGQNRFLYLSPPGSVCSSDSLELFVELYPVPSFEFTAEGELCFGDNNGMIELLITDNTGDQISCYLDDILQEGGKIIEGLAPGSYELYIENEFCTSETAIVEIDAADPVTVSLGDDREININEELIITAITNLLDSDIESVSWFDLAGILETDVLELRQTFANNTVISIEITDENGCVAFDQINIDILPTDIYIPNIFNPNSLDNRSFGIGNPEAVALVNSFLIFDRWGNKIIDESNIDPQSDRASWDGFYNNTRAVPGVYVYVYDLELRDGSRQLFTGDLTLVR